MARSSRVRRRQRLAGIGLVSIAVFVMALVVLHATALGRLPSHMSQFANSPFGLFWALALYCLILGTSALVWALRPCLCDGLSKRLGLGMLSLAAIGALLLATFPSDAVEPVTWKGTLHEDAAAATFVLLAGAMVVLAPAFRSSPSFSRFAGVSLLLGLLVGLSLAVYLVTTFNGMAARGPVQRILVALILAWFASLAVQLFRLRDENFEGAVPAVPIAERPVRRVTPIHERPVRSIRPIHERPVHAVAKEHRRPRKAPKSAA